MVTFLLHFALIFIVVGQRLLRLFGAPLTAHNHIRDCNRRVNNSSRHQEKIMHRPF